MARFEGKVALVTGGGSGIGEAITRRLARDGATVIAADRSHAVAADLGDGVVARHLDVSSEDSVLELEEWIRTEFGGLDILANNAGISGPVLPIHEFPIEEFDKVISINVRGRYLVLQSGIRLMLASGGGAIVITASLGGFRATPAASAYITSKGADVMLTRVAALEYAQQNIRVNAVAPGVIHTPILDGQDDLVAFLKTQVPQGRLGATDEVANVVAFLADDAEASHITGAVWVIDGGRSAG